MGNLFTSCPISSAPTSFDLFFHIRFDVRSPARFWENVRSWSSVHYLCLFQLVQYSRLLLLPRTTFFLIRKYVGSISLYVGTFCALYLGFIVVDNILSKMVFFSTSFVGFLPPFCSSLSGILPTEVWVSLTKLSRRLYTIRAAILLCATKFDTSEINTSYRLFEIIIALSCSTSAWSLTSLG